MNYYLILAGLLFFVNPCIGIVDILPDFAGALLIICGIGGFRLINGKFQGAFKALWYYTVIEAVKFALSFAEFKEPVTVLVSAFSFAVVEAYLLFLIIGRLTDGFESVCLRFGTAYESYSFPSAVKREERYRQKHPQSKKVFKTSGEKYGLDAMKKSLIVYTFVRIVLCTLPEFTSLDSGVTINTVIQSMTEFRMMFYVLFAPVVIIWMIFTVVRTVNTFRVLNADGQMKINTRDAYARLSEERPILIRTERQKNSYIILFFAFVFSVFLFMDGYDVMPKVIASLALIFFFLYEDCGRVKKLAGVFMSLLSGAAYGFYLYASRLHHTYKTEVFELDLNNPVCIAEMEKRTLILNASTALTAVTTGIALFFAALTLYSCCCEAYRCANELQVKKAITFAAKKIKPVLIIIPVKVLAVSIHGFVYESFNLMSFIVSLTEVLTVLCYFMYKVKDDDDFV